MASFDEITPWALIVFIVIQLITLVKMTGPGMIKSLQDAIRDRQEHHQKVQMTEQEVTRLEVLQTLHNQTYRDEQSTIFLSNQQDLVTELVEAIIKDFKVSQDTHALQLSRIKEVIYENRELLRRVEKAQAAIARRTNNNYSIGCDNDNQTDQNQA